MRPFEQEALRRLGLHEGAELIRLNREIFQGESFVEFDPFDEKQARHNDLMLKFMGEGAGNEEASGDEAD